MNDASKKSDAILHQALEIQSPDQREAFLSQACGTDTALLKKLQAILEETAAEEYFDGLDKTRASKVDPVITSTSGEIADRFVHSHPLTGTLRDSGTELLDSN